MAALSPQHSASTADGGQDEHERQVALARALGAPFSAAHIKLVRERSSKLWLEAAKMSALNGAYAAAFELGDLDRVIRILRDIDEFLADG